MKELMTFNLNGISSSKFGILNANNGTGLYNELFVAQRTIKEELIPGNDTPYFEGVTRTAPSFPLLLYMENGFTDDGLRQIKRWIDQDEYCEFYFEELPYKRWFFLMDSSSSLTHNGSGEGYFEVNMRSLSPYAYSAEYKDDVIDLSNNSSEGTVVTFENKGDADLLPEMWIYKVGSGNCSITNLTDKGSYFEFLNLNDGETVYVDNDSEDIVSDIPGRYLFDNFNDNFLNMKRGINRLLVQGDCQIQFQYRYIYK